MGGHVTQPSTENEASDTGVANSPSYDRPARTIEGCSHAIKPLPRPDPHDARLRIEEDLVELRSGDEGAIFHARVVVVRVMASRLDSKGLVILDECADDGGHFGGIGGEDDAAGLQGAAGRGPVFNLLERVGHGEGARDLDVGVGLKVCAGVGQDEGEGEEDGCGEPHGE